jgi:hypothetical protein
MKTSVSHNGHFRISIFFTGDEKGVDLTDFLNKIPNPIPRIRLNGNKLILNTEPNTIPSKQVVTKARRLKIDRNGGVVLLLLLSKVPQDVH